MQLVELTRYLDDYLRIRDVPDAPEALNGLQVENAGQVTRIAAAVDLCEATVQLALAQRADLLLVHHGLFWSGLRPLVGPAYKRVAALVTQGIALYSAHLPLDRRLSIAGVVLIRQRPGSANGVVFITIEDESGIANLVIWPTVFEKQRRIILSAGLMAVYGRIQREGDVVHL